MPLAAWLVWRDVSVVMIYLMALVSIGACVTMAFNRRLNIISTYESLEQRFNTAARMMVASIFLLWGAGAEARIA